MSVLSYKTIEKISTGIYKEKASKFIATAFPIVSVEAFNNKLEEVKDLYPKARHYCWAYKMNFDGSAYRLNDDGEPSGTAGKPIMGQLESFGITNAAIIVTRYFGGTKLGASGLIQAYKQASEMALQENSIIEKLVETRLNLKYSDTIYPKVQSTIGNIKGIVTDIKYLSHNTIELVVALKNKDQLLQRIYESLTGFSADTIVLKTDTWELTEMDL